MKWYTWIICGPLGLLIGWGISKNNTAEWLLPLISIAGICIEAKVNQDVFRNMKHEIAELKKILK